MSAEEADIDLTRYRIISKIGEGSFSKVYRAKDSKTNKSYAAKVCKFMVDEDTQDSEEARLLFREVNLMSLLNHPSVLKFIGYYSTNFDDDPLPTIITELAVNGSLRDIIKMEAQGLSPSEWNHTKKLINIYGIAAGMSYLHAHNVLHRDLKPENILVDEYLHPKISDFGLSKITDFLSASMNFQSQRGTKGTPAYMAPEIMSEEKYSKSGDVYAFGFIVYEIMTCEEPFKNYDIYKLMKKVMNEGYRPPIRDDVPNVYRELIEKCWSQKSEERPSFDQIVSELKTNDEFISELVDETEYYDYVDFIDKYRSTFDVSKRTIHFSDFIKHQGRNKEIKPILFGSYLSDDETSTESVNNEQSEPQNISNETEKKEESTQNKQTLSNENQQKIHESENKPMKINESENEPMKINENENINIHKIVYPLEEFHKLSKNNQNLVEMTEKDSEKSFQVGQFLIEGKNGFPNNIALGMKYIEHSVNEKCVEAIVYYIELLIKGKIIPEDLTKANEYLAQLSQLLNTKDSRQFLLQGLMSYKKNKFKEAAKFYLEGIKLGDAVCMYKYGKMLFIGEGTEKNDKESFKHFIKSNELGYSKSGYFLSSLKSLNKIKKFSKLSSETQMIFIMNNIKNKVNEQESEFKSIFLSPKKTEKVFFNKTLKSANFYECLKHYQHINIELEYPSESFKSIIDLVIKIHKKHHIELNIGVVFSSFKKRFTKECFLNNISYHRIDSSIDSIPSETFKNLSSLTQITIPSSVTQIGESAFEKCSSLTQITIPSSVTQIGESAFEGCSSLTQIAIPSSVTQIGKLAFYGCSSLSEITIPSSVTQIGKLAFWRCSSLSEITIPSSVNDICGGVFNECIKLREIAIESNRDKKFEYFEEKFFLCKCNLTSEAFDILLSFTSKVETTIIPPFIKKIENNAFAGCSSLQQITIPSSITQIGDSAFYGCLSLREITIPSSVTQIGDSAFWGCSSLREITIPSSVTQIGDSAFEGCLSLREITIPSSVTQIGDFAFWRCSSLREIAIPSSLITDNIGLKSNVKITKI